MSKVGSFLARAEAKPTCVEACPLHIDIKRFIARLAEGDWKGAHDVISEQSPFPGVCGRVCQHELFCERACIIGKKWAPVAIGSLERFAADHARSRLKELADSYPKPTGQKVALIGSGPASLIVAYDLVRLNYRVTVFEALHQLGGVLAYGIPNFRLPREILHEEISRLESMGVEFVPDFILGKTATIYELFEEGYEAIFVGTGAGLPYLMGIPGENLIGVYTANEFLTRVNLMEAYKFPDSPTPVRVGECTVVVGGGNSAMDAARWAVRFGSETTILYRRGRAELKARIEEIQHAEEEGVRFEFLSAPVALYGDGNGLVKEMECIQMELGEPDQSGRRSPVPIPGSEYRKWEHDEELTERLHVAEKDSEEYAHLQAARTLGKAFLRVRQALNSSTSECPLKTDQAFKAKFVEYLLLSNDSFIWIQPDERDPLPTEQDTEKTKEQIDRCFTAHANWLNKYASRLTAELSMRKTTT